MRTQFTLRCTVCKSENYRYSKNKKTHPDRMEVKKYCPVCKKITVHKEKK